MHDRPRLLVVGGGIGGIAFALAAARRSLPVHVLERAGQLGEIGAGIQLAPNALRVLDELGVLDEVYESAVFPPRAVLMDAVTGEPITAVRFGEVFRDTYGYPYAVTHRSDLHASLLQACRASGLVTFETGREVVSLSERDASVHLATADGSTYDTDLVVGADGLHSVVREYVVGDGEPRCAGHVAYRGLVPYSAVAEREGKDDVTWWAGPKMHLMQYPVRRGELHNQVAVFASDRYPSESQEWGLPEELDLRLAGKHEYVRQGGALVDRGQRWVMVDRDPASNWTRGGVTLLGDAAHPMLQYLAQGGCQAIEDALVLAEALAAHRGRPRDAFGVYQDARIARTTSVQTWARHLGEIVHADGVTAILRDALLQPRDPDDLTYFDWLYGYEASLSPA